MRRHLLVLLCALLQGVIGQAVAQTAGVQPAVRMHGKQLPWEHEIQVALPPGYEQSDKRYPVLWLTDGHAIFAESLHTVRRLTTQVPQMIIVGVGVPAEAVAEFQARRGYDFSPFDDWKHTTAPGRDVFNKANEALDEFTKKSGMGVADRAGGAPHFLSFLVDEVRPALAKKYRMTDQHILFGHSSGGTFCTYALLARPESFKKYICSSAGLYGGNGYFFELENRYARTHDDLKAEVFFAAGEDEILQPTIAGIGLVSSTSRMAEVLTERKYPSLELSMRIFPAEDHATTLPRSLSWGLRALLKAD